MKIRTGFVSNSSSSSFLIPHSKLDEIPSRVNYALLTEKQRTALIETEDSIDPEAIDILKLAEPVYLTEFISDGNDDDYEACSKHGQYLYCGGHGGPYTPEDWTSLNDIDTDDYGTVCLPKHIANVPESIEKKIEKLQTLIDVQYDSYDYDPYMLGMYNGMVLAMSVLDGKEPEFMEAPEVWGCDRMNQAMGLPHEN
jgi:hypothetical protein